MSRLMIIGCGGVASVAIHKCCQPGIFGDYDRQQDQVQM